MESTSPYRIPGMELIDHSFNLPLDYNDPTARKIKVFVREDRDVDPKTAEKPLLLFLQGGPGFRATFPTK